MATQVVPLSAALLSEEQAAEILHAKKQTLRAWRVRRKGPPYFKLNGRVLYKPQDLEEWIEKCRIVPGEKLRRTVKRRGSR